MNNDERYDIILFGATGFTGKLVAEYLAQKCGDGASQEAFTWAIAGRNAAKLGEVKVDLGLHDDVGTITAVTDDFTSLTAMTAQARVLLTTVGPYVLYGEPLVRACVETGTDYVDITGEPEFVNSIIARYHEPARAKGLRIVNCCGFDSIPHDLGVYMLMNEFAGSESVIVDGYVSANGNLSGGTWHSAITAMSRSRAQNKQPSAARVVVGEGRVVRGGKPRVRYEEAVNGWVAPMPTIDPQIVLRSARMLPAYGPNFTYAHYLRVGSLPKVVGLGAGVGAVAALAQFGPTRKWLLNRRKPGEGPTAAERAQGSFRVTFVGTVDGQRVMAEVSGGDPGYAETSKMVAESALCLALDGAQLPAVAGVLTTAVAMGEPLLARLRGTGMVFKVHEGK